MKKSIFLLIILFTVYLCPAQTENKIWYFGENAGLDFNYDPPKAITNNRIIVEEGSGVVCDPDGNLLLYTGGGMVYNRNHEPMLSNLLMSNNSATQKGVPCAYPGDSTKCYLFSSGAQEGGCIYGLRYSVIDMSLEDGLGDFSDVANVMLLERGSEKIGIAEHDNGTDKWICTHEFLENRIIAWPITNNGIGEPVYSPLGYDLNLNHTWNRAGYMTFTRDFSKMAMAMYFAGIVLVYDFNSSTGEFDNLIVLNPLDGFGQYAYGVEFSPDGSKLYCSKRGRAPSRVFQYDLSLGSEDAINDSRITLAEVEGNENMDHYSALMLGPDDKIYVASHKHDFLHRIDNPNAAGTACNFAEDAVYLEGKLSLKGLPARAWAVPVSSDTSNTDPDPDTSDVVGLNPEMGFECDMINCTVPGNKVSIPYTIEYSDEILKSGNMSGIVEAQIQFDRFILYPDDTKIQASFEDGIYRIATLRETISSGNGYIMGGEIQFYAGLGKQESTTIDIIGLTINGISYNTDTLNLTSGCACIEVCNAGGKRLINPEGEPNIILHENPAGETADLEIELIEDGRTTVQIIDITGRIVGTILDRTINGESLIEISYNTENLHSGLYGLRLTTPTVSKCVLLRIFK